MHAPNLQHASLLAEHRDEIKKQKTRLFPKLSNGWVTAASFDDNTWGSLPGNNQRTPISCRVFCVNPKGNHWTLEGDPEAKEVIGDARIIYQDLQKLGCRIGSHAHSVPDGQESYWRQVCIALPHVKVDIDEKTKRPDYTRDIEGCGLFLGYLLHQGHVSADEIKEAFGEQFLELALDKNVVERIEKMLNNEPPPASSALIPSPKKR